MKIAVSVMGTDLDAQVDPRFGRCEYFIIVNPDTLEFYAIENPCQYFVIVDPDTLKSEATENPNLGAIDGAGIQSGKLMAEKGVQVVLTGNVGPNAFQALSTAGIQIITGVTGTVKSAIERFNSGQLRPVSGTNVPDHFTARIGRSIRRNRGRRMRLGMVSGTQPIAPPSRGVPRQQQVTPEQELQALKNQAEAMKQQLDQIVNKIEDLVKE